MFKCIKTKTPSEFVSVRVEVLKRYSQCFDTACAYTRKTSPQYIARPGTSIDRMRDYLKEF
jgi:hypothetical protein